jgi:hypothetical protein
MEPIGVIFVIAIIIVGALAVRGERRNRTP